MNPLFEAAREVGALFAERTWPYCVIGGLAVQRWGEPRTTLDVDMTVLAGWGEEERYVTAILGRFRSRIQDAHSFGVARRVLLIQASNGKDVDIALGALPFEAEMIRRAVPVEFAPGVVLPCCTAEDLFVMKAFSGRPRDWLDAESIVVRQRDLNVGEILARLGPLLALKEAPELLDRARRLLRETP